MLLMCFQVTLAEMSLPTLTPVWKWMPSCSRRRMRRWTILRDSFIVGIPYCNSPPTASSRSNTVTKCPAYEAEFD